MEAEKLIPVTRTVTTSKGDVTVRQFEIEDVIVVINEIADLIGGTSEDDLKQDDKSVLITVARNPKFLDSVKRILAQLSGKDKAFFDHLPLIDMLNLIKAFIAINDLKKLRQVFLELKETILGQTQQNQAK